MSKVTKDDSKVKKEMTWTAIRVAIFASLYSAFILSFGAYSLVSIWPVNSTELASNTTTVTLRGTGVSFSLGSETLLMLVMIIVGAIGACVFFPLGNCTSSRSTKGL